MDNADPRKARQKRIWITLAVIFALAFLYCWFFGFATLMVLQTRWTFRKSPVAYAVPKPLPNSLISTDPGKTFTVGDFELEVPWADAEQVNRTLPPNCLALTTPSGLGVLVMSGRPRALVESVDLQQSKAFVQVYGPEVMKSDYSFAQYMLSTTPKTVHLTSSKREIVSRSMMLIIKSITLPESASEGVFSLQAPGFRGFQYGDPSKGLTKIVAALYSPDAKVEFIFSRKNGPLTLTQPEINRVIQSLHKKLS